ncbi:hypothetical protein [Nocardioides sp. YIM 152315]|uniref:hypothetical protein n=1 Tax=Nocardioides sp. YIM 152315 TaxID=3031760 RepID=UPI0023DB7749|nr:hypothetical protein [Nocardioides sp. YIM 152315]MDF1605936.1 hypothetical protein [Nocardioides sp. YIM 152315]
MTARHHAGPRLGALAAVALLVTAMVTALTGTTAHAAAARRAPAAGTVSNSCTIQPFGNEFDYTAKVKVTGKKTKKTKAALTAKLGAMPGVSPVAVNAELSATMKVTVGGRSATLKGKRTVDVGANEPVPMPKLKGTAKVAKSAKKLPVVVKSISFEIATFGVTGDCAPTDGATLSKLKLG